MAAAFGGGENVHYAAKAFLCSEIARWVDEEGLSLDVASGGELAVALHAGFPAERIALHGNNKSVEELTSAVKAGVGHVVLDSMTEIDRLDAIAGDAGVVQDVLIRVTVGVEAHTHEFIATAHEDQKFGLSLAGGAAITAVRRVFAADNLRLVGLHSHIGSQIFDVDGFELAAHRIIGLLRDIVAEFGVDKTAQIATVDLGGGLGISYLPHDDPPPVDDLAAKLGAIVRNESAAVGLPAPRLVVEPGRAIAGPGTITLYEVGTVKDVAVSQGMHRRYVSVDGGMSDNIRTSLYGAEYDVRLVSRVSDACPDPGTRRRKALRERRHRRPRRLGARRRAAGRPAGGGRDRRLLLLDVEPVQPARPPRRGGRARRAIPPDPAPGDRRRSAESGSEVTDGTRSERSRGAGDIRGGIGVAVLGLGNVGSEVVRIIEESAPDLAARIGAPLELRGVGGPPGRR